jgi:hypothetical protein
MSPDNFGRGRCPMSVAAELGHNHILEFLIAAGGKVIRSRGSSTTNHWYRRHS